MIVTKRCANLKCAERVQSKLYDQYNKVRLIDFPELQDAGIYKWDVSDEIIVVKRKREDIPNVHVIRVYNIPHSHTKPARMKLFSERFKSGKFLSYTNFNSNRAEENAIEYLTENGFEIIGVGEGEKGMYILSSTFKQL